MYKALYKYPITIKGGKHGTENDNYNHRTCTNRIGLGARWMQQSRKGGRNKGNREGG